MRLALARKKAPCHDRVCAFPNIGIEEFTSWASEHLLSASPAWPHITSHALSRFRSVDRSNFVASRRAASRLFSAIRPSARIQCPCKANGGLGTAVNYPLYTALALEPILNDPSNLAGRERGRERVEREWWDTSPSPCAKKHRKFTGATKIARRRQQRRRRQDRRRRGDARWTRRIFPRIIWYSNVPAT